MRSCPNLNNPAIAEKYDAIKNDPELGQVEAMREFLLSEKEGRDMASPEQVKQKLKAIFTPRTDEEIKAIDDAQTAITSTYIGDSTFTNSDTNSGITYLNNPPTNLRPDMEAMDSAKAQEIANKFSKQLGIPYFIVTPEQAVEITKDSKNPYNSLKGKAFFYQGSVYFIGNSLSTVTAFHEFSHPVAKALRLSNIKLFDKLVDEALKAEPSLLEEAYQEYADLRDAINSEKDPVAKQEIMNKYEDAVKEEILVKALTKSAMLKAKNEKPSTGFAGFIKNLLYSIKQFLRKTFGQKINISKLDETTTINDLAEMLKAGKNFDIDTKLMSKDEIVRYMEERDALMADLARLDEKDLAVLSTNAFDIAKKQVKLLIENKNYKALANLLVDEYKRGDLQEIMSNLKQYSGDIIEKAQKLVNDMERTKDNTAALVNTMYRLNKVMNHINSQLTLMKKQGKDLQTEKDNLGQAYYYKHILDYWTNYISIAKDTLKNAGVEPSSPMYKMLREMEDVGDSANQSIMDIYRPGAGAYLWEQLSDLAEAADEEFNSIIKLLKDKKANQSSIDKRYKEYHNLTEFEYNRMKQLRSSRDAGERLDGNQIQELEAYERAHRDSMQLTKEKVELALIGQLKDANFLNNFLEGYMYSTDPVIGGFAAFFKNNMSEVQVKAQNNAYDFMTAIQPLIKEAGLNLTMIGESGRKLGFIDTVGGIDPKTGEFIEGGKKRWTLLNRFKNYRYEIDKFDYEIDKAEAIYFKSGDTEDGKKLAELKIAKARHLKTWFQQEFVDSFYEKDSVFDKGPNDDIGAEAKRRRDKIFEEMRKVTEPLTSEGAMLDASEKMAELWREYRLLHSFYNLNGKLKVGDELAIAERLVEYRNVSRDFYEFRLRTGAFENAYNKFKIETEDKLRREGFQKGSKPYDEEFERQKQRWLSKNTVTKIKQEFYDERARILKKIKDILNTVPANLTAKQKEQYEKKLKDLDFTEDWTTILDSTAGFRDENGQPLGNEMSEGRKANVKSAQEAIIKAQEKWAGYSGLSSDQMERLQYLFLIKKTEGLSKEEEKEFYGLLEVKDKLGLTKYQRQDLYDAYSELSALQSKTPTEAYLEAANYQLDKLDTSKIGFNEVTADNVDAVFSAENLKDLFKQSDEFKEWFEKNHVKRKGFDLQTKKKVDRYERLYVWSIIKPNSQDYYESTEIKNAQGEVEETISGVPSLKYFARVVKKEFRTGYNPNKENTDGTKGGVELVVGVHIDNKGNFLPKDIEGSPYRNEAYYELKENNPALFKLLETVTKYHLDWQKGNPRTSKLYMDFPRYPKSDLEFAQSGLVKKKVGEKLSFIQQIIQKIRNFFLGSRADMETGLNLNMNNQFKLVQTDMFDNKINKIPISGLYDIDEDETSTDIFTSMMRFMYAGETQKKLIEINPVAQSIRSLLNNDKNRLKELDQINKTNAKTRNIISFVNKEGKYVRQEQFEAFYQTNFLAQSNAGWGGDIAWIQNATNFMFGQAANSFFALNIPSALKNSFGAKFQALIMSAAGRYFNMKHYAKGEAWSSKTMAKLSFNVYKGPTTDLDLLLIETFDPSQGRTQEKLVGTYGKPGKFSRTLASDIADRSWLVSVRKWTELQSTLAGFGAMMYKKTIKKEDGSEIPYIEAFEVKDGKLVLKPGIDPKWGITYDAEGNPILGSEFKKMKNQIHMVTNKLVGAVSKADQPDAKRYLLFRMATFMKGYFTEMFLNRFAKKRMNVGLGTPDEGYYVTAVKSLLEMARTKNIAHMSPRDAEAFKMMFAEVAGLVLLAILPFSMFGGFDPDDPDRYAKLRKKAGVLPFPFVGEGESDFHLGGFLEVHSMLLMMQIQQENRQFLDPSQLIPMVTDLKSIAFGPTLNSYAKICQDLIYLMTGSDKAYYERREGAYEWQQQDGLKLWNHIAKMYGVNATSLSPVDALKRWSDAQQLSNFR